MQLFKAAARLLTLFISKKTLALLSKESLHLLVYFGIALKWNNHIKLHQLPIIYLKLLLTILALISKLYFHIIAPEKVLRTVNNSLAALRKKTIYL